LETYLYHIIPSIPVFLKIKRRIEMKKTVSFGLVLVLLLACVGAVSAVNLVQNPGFEDPEAADPFTANMATGLTDWTIESGNIDLIGTLWTPYELAQSIDLSGCERATIKQSIVTVPGKEYKVSFALAGNTYDAPATKTVEVFWDGGSRGTFDFDTTGLSNSDMGWKIIEIPNLKATTTSTEIKFRDVTPVGDYPSVCVGVALDNIVAEEQSNNVPVPEFPTMALPVALIVGLLGAVLFIQASREH
jgi:choice-of-anchor C domain-containing protein